MRMPVMFLGHGSPMNAIEHNEFTDEWSRIGKIYTPKAILMISAHWFTNGTYTQDAEYPQVINDMYGFPKELYEVNYQVKGDIHLSNKIIEYISRPVKINNNWGIDHGGWSVLNHMYPKRDIPVVQMSIDANASEEDHFRMGQELSRLRDEEVLIIGSGNIVHNLRKARLEIGHGYEWNIEFDQFIKNAIEIEDYLQVLNYQNFGEVAKLSVPTTEHFDPLLYVLGAVYKKDKLRVFNEAHIAGALSMTSYIFESE